MTNKNSIFFTISAFFTIVLLLMILSFSMLFNANDMKKRDSIRQEHKGIVAITARAMHGNQEVPIEVQKELKELGYELVTNANTILLNPHIKIIDRFALRHLNVEAMILDDDFYLHLQTPFSSTLIKDNNKRKHGNFEIVLLFVFLIVLFVFLYLATLKKLYPLKTLQEKVKELANENYDIDCKSDKKDEISLLANEFDTTAKKLKKLKEARNVFIRNIMHELKTPITKGKFLTELPQNEQNSEKLKRVFLRLESLINEFATIEQLLSSKTELKTKEYFLQDIIDNAIDLLMIDENQVIQKQQNIKVNVDFKLFSIVIKNLIDNAIKYSTDKKVTIYSNSSKIIITNNGSPLKRNFEDYFEPFVKETDNQNSFGLGLYIVKHILDAHLFSISYNFNDKNHIIVINLSHESCNEELH